MSALQCYNDVSNQNEENVYCSIKHKFILFKGNFRFFISYIAHTVSTHTHTHKFIYGVRHWMNENENSDPSLEQCMKKHWKKTSPELPNRLFIVQPQCHSSSIFLLSFVVVFFCFVSFAANLCLLLRHCYDFSFTVIAFSPASKRFSVRLSVCSFIFKVVLIETYSVGTMNFPFYYFDVLSR